MCNLFSNLQIHTFSNFLKMSQIISTVMQQAQEAFEHYRQVSGKNRAIFLETIAEEIEGLKDSLVAIAHQETNLPCLDFKEKLDEQQVNYACLLV
jgi:acyl-CoA reductase-like NAD-dependent aldehyde dehydrogenase